MNPLFSSSIVWYLFLGGAGSGAYIIASIVNLVRDKQGAGTKSWLKRFVDAGQLLGFFIVLLGVVFLISDLGRVDRAYTLFTQPTFSMASIGAYAILLFSISAAYPIAVRHLALPEITPFVTTAVEWMSIVFGVLVMTYTGLLLESLQVVSFWASPLVPVLFVLSSLSSGIALLLVCGFVLGPERVIIPLLHRLSRADAAVAVCEAIVLAVFILVMRADVSASVSVDLLVSGRYAEAFWAGYVACGLLAPLVVQLFARRRVQARVFSGLGLVLLVGGFCLRYCIVHAGVHDALLKSLGV